MLTRFCSRGYFRKSVLVFLLALLILPVAVMAEDTEGSADHLRIPRLPGYKIINYTAG